MIVITLSKSVPSLRGDLSRWLFEISPGVYVGKVSARVREGIWQRISGAIGQGKATMVYSCAGEQKLQFRTLGTDWHVQDFDGFQLMMHPIVKKEPGSRSDSKAKKYQIILDVETTGLNSDENQIIEIGALKLDQNGIVVDRFQSLIKHDGNLSETIVKLTGITDQKLQEKGRNRMFVFEAFLLFIEKWPIICYNAPFDKEFLNSDLAELGIEPVTNEFIDVLDWARKYLKGLPNYRLSTVAEFLGIEIKQAHRALGDCFVLLNVFAKLKKKALKR